MQEYQQAPGVHEPKDMRMWGCKDINKHSEYIKLRIWECADARIPTSIRSTWTSGYGDVRYQHAPVVHKPKDMRIWGYENTNKHPKYINLKIRGCEDTRFQASIHKTEEMRMLRCKWGHMNPRTWRCKYARIQASTYEHKDIRMRGCKDTSKCTGT